MCTSEPQASVKDRMHLFFVMPLLRSLSQRRFGAISINMALLAELGHADVNE